MTDIINERLLLFFVLFDEADDLDEVDEEVTEDKG